VVTGFANIPYGFLGSFYRGDWGVQRNFKIVALAVTLALGFLLLRELRRLWLAWSQPAGADAATATSRRWLLPALVVCGVPVLALVSFSLFLEPAMASRFVMGAAIPFWIAAYLVCEANGRLGRAVLFGALLPWVLLSAADAYLYYYRPNWQHDTAVLMARAAQPGDVLLAEDPDQGNAIYWELTHRLHRPADGLVALRVRSRHAVDMGIVRTTALESLPLDAAQYIWFTGHSGRNQDLVDSYLRAHGFQPDPHLAAGVARLTIYVRTPAPASAAPQTAERPVAAHSAP
jgi:hypothetical protein